MSTLTIDEKLSLIEKMRNHANASHSPAQMPGLGQEAEDAAAEPEQVIGTFRLRVFVCVLAFCAFWGLYKGKIEIKGHPVTEVKQLLEKNQLPGQADNYLETLAKNIVEQMGKTN